MIDLRSDTVTKPTPEMREAMANAEVGDDVYGEDPTVNRLEEEAARLLGKEAALFLVSGTMANQAAVLAHTQRGHEVLLDPEAHIGYYEVGSSAMFAGVQLRAVPGLLQEGAAEVLTSAYRGEDLHFPITSLVCLENTFNRGGGTIMSPEEMKRVYDTAKGLGLRVHVDGARIFNAAVASDMDVREFSRNCDSIMFCLSKGLCAPVGSLLAGDAEFIARGRKYRKALGGGMRQAGILAAAGLEALKLTGRLKEDHKNARHLAEALNAFEGIKVDLEKVQTNIVIADVSGTGLTGAQFTAEAKNRGLGITGFGQYLVRFVAHKDVSASDMDNAIDIISGMIQ